MKSFLSWFKGPERTEAPPAIPTYDDIVVARNRIAPLVPASPVTRSICLSEDLGLDIYLKWENKLRTGSFKERGAANFLLSLSDTDRERGVCAASAGNHALGLSYYAARLGVQCHLVMPTTAPLVKVEACRKTGAHITLEGSTLSEAFQHAMILAKEKNLVFVPPYDHSWIIAGQGTCGLEIADQLPNIDSIVVPVGGGGLISGIAIALKEKRPDLFVLGVRSEWAEHAKHNPSGMQKRRMPPSIADGIAVKEIGAITGEVITRYVDKMVTVTEDQIAAALVSHLELEHSVVEGSAAAGLAALYNKDLPSKYKSPCFVISGSNIDTGLLSRLLERQIRLAERIVRLRVSLPDRPGALHDLTGVVAKSGANILQVHHDRFSARRPGGVTVTMLLEVRNGDHGRETALAVSEAGFESEA